jgi:hypothetical protein
MSTTREIPREDWKEFSRSFSQEHDQCSVTLEVMGSELGAQIQGHELRLRGLSPEEKREDSDFALLLETPNGEHLTHTISKPTQIWLEEDPEGTDVALEIKSADTTTTLVRLL